MDRRVVVFGDERVFHAFHYAVTAPFHLYGIRGEKGGLIMAKWRGVRGGYEVVIMCYYWI